MNEIWKNCEDMMDQLAAEKQDKIEKIIEEVTQEKFERIAELKASFEFMIKRLDQGKQKDKADLKRKERDDEVRTLQEQMEGLKKEKLDKLNKEFEEKKRELMTSNKDKQIQEASHKLTKNGGGNVSRISLVQTPQRRSQPMQINQIATPTQVRGTVSCLIPQ